MALKVYPRILSHSGPKHSASVIWLHGSGDTGSGIMDYIKSVWIEDFSFPHIRFIFPTADLFNYTPSLGELTHVWFDRKRIDQDVEEDLPSTENSAKKLNVLVQEEVDKGIPLSRIVIGGFSMGGGMAMHMAYRHRPEIAGCFALSSFLNKDSIVYKIIEEQKRENKKLPPLFQCHGTKDDLVLFDWGKITHKNLTDLGIDGEFQEFKINHEFIRPELDLLRKWILNRLPEI